MKSKSIALSLMLVAVLFTGVNAQEPNPPKPPSPPPHGKGGPSQDSPEMQELLESFHLTPEQRTKYDAAKAETSKQMRAIHEGKMNGTLPQDEVLKQALAAHKAFNAAVQQILTPEQYAQWEPLRESDHHKIAQAHKDRDEKTADDKTKAAQ